MTEETPQRTPPRPRGRGRASTGGSGKKVLLSVAAIVLLAIGGYAGYTFLGPLFSSESTTGGAETSTSTPATDVSPPLPPAGAPAPSSSPTPGRPGPTPPTSVAPTSPPLRPGSPGSSPTGGAEPARPPATTPARPTPSQSPSTPSRSVAGASASGTELLKNGRYSEAARSYLEQLKSNGADKFTIAVGVYCEAANVGRTFSNSGQSDRLIVLPYQYKGQPCYRVFWGLYDSQEAAQRDLASVPAAIRSPQSVPVPTSQLLR